MTKLPISRESSKRDLSLPSPPLEWRPAEALRRALRVALQDALIGAGGLGLWACAANPPALPTEGFIPRTCEQKSGSSFWRPLPGLTPAMSVDSLTFRNDYDVSQWGIPCAGAKDKAACESRFDRINQAEADMCSIPGCQPRLIFTRGDQVGQLYSVEQVRDFLGPIDSADDAAMVLRMSGLSIGCTVERGGVRSLPSGSFEVRAQRHRGDCETDSVLMQVNPDGLTKELDASIPPRNPNCAVGRLPSGLCKEPTINRAPHGSIGAFLADAARLEAASVPAFLMLARDLARVGAPQELVAWAQGAAEDEITHVRVTQALAEAYGAPADNEVKVRVTPPASLITLAMENAVEGCVRETFGAAVAAYQAECAEDPTIAAAMSRIACDEADHAALAHELDAWLHTQLSPQEQAAVRRAKQDAVAAFREGLNVAYEEEVHRAAGFPHMEVALRLHDSLFSQLAC